MARRNPKNDIPPYHLPTPPDTPEALAAFISEARGGRSDIRSDCPTIVVRGVEVQPRVGETEDECRTRLLRFAHARHSREHRHAKRALRLLDRKGAYGHVVEPDILTVDRGSCIEPVREGSGHPIYGIRAAKHDGRVWLVFKDICKSLGIANPTLALRTHGHPDRAHHTLYADLAMPRAQPDDPFTVHTHTLLVSPVNYLRLIVRSRSATAKEAEPLLEHAAWCKAWGLQAYTITPTERAAGLTPALYCQETLTSMAHGQLMQQARRRGLKVEADYGPATDPDPTPAPNHTPESEQQLDNPADSPRSSMDNPLT